MHVVYQYGILCPDQSRSWSQLDKALITLITTRMNKSNTKYKAVYLSEIKVE